ncbi:BamA/TamA family outer membrane protein [Aureibacter tunicatorum]|uniref:Bacterial surface antigen (D15) domain-containing protein n=1 Tax=Aureibacter tunicatorum TaxID=866807 RepID=A0AAE3XHF7_9BACT|nr:BamA/TamA family outer membrane protein [Aureibacter tunicatorum]MDR6237741.1 hypothetical protein [Aureibacter tunicatorum]BDD02776.1 membrane protein [Aureibacter tunicatorum]
MAKYFITTFIIVLTIHFSTIAQKPVTKQIANGIEAIDSMVVEALSKDVGIIPAPTFNPSFGAGIAILPMIVYKNPKMDSTTNPSTIQGLGFLNFKGSYITGIKSTIYTNRNAFWIDGYAGYLNMKMKNLKSSGVENPQNLYFSGFSSNITVLRKIFNNFYGGLLFNSNYLNESSEQNKDEDYHWYNSIGLKVSYDSRNDIFFPSSGFFINMNYQNLINSHMSPYGFDKFNFNLSNYISLNGTDNMILAYKLHTQLGWGSLPLHEKASPGGSSVLKGYITGNYIDNSIMTLQAEYRWMFAQRWGVVGFVGYGWLFDQVHNFHQGMELPSYGFGVRHKLFKQFKINLSFDVSFGRDNTNFQIGLNESF